MNMNVKEKIKERVNDINDPRLLDELLKAVELEHEIEHIDQLSYLEKKLSMKEFLTLNQGNSIQTLRQVNWLKNG